MIIACVILLALDIVVLIFSRILYVYFDSPIMSTWSPALPFIIFWVLVLAILIIWQVSNARIKHKLSELPDSISMVTMIVLFFFFLSWLFMLDGFYIGDIKRETRYVDNEVIVLFKVEETLFSQPFIYVGEPLSYGFMRIKNKYYKYENSVEFNLQYQKMGLEVIYEE